MNDRDPELDDWKRALNAPYDPEATLTLLVRLAGELPPQRPPLIAKAQESADEAAPNRCPGCGRRVGHPLCALSDGDAGPW